jgi:hypothetical protein
MIAPASVTQIMPAMIEAGAAALMDGSELTRQFGPTDAEYYAERILHAALSSPVPGAPAMDWLHQARPETLKADSVLRVRRSTLRTIVDLCFDWPEPSPQETPSHYLR